MAKIEILIPVIIKWEAGVDPEKEGNIGLSANELFEKARATGFGNDPVDSGGATMVGVTLATYKAYRKTKGKKAPTAADLRKITYEEWADILKTMFWDKMKADGFGWWIRRIEGAEKLFDVIRIDHFRGLESYWSVPAGDDTARNGCWKPGPGMALLNALKETCPNTEFIAEDLGYMTPEVKKLQEDSGYPGMKVLEFAFDGDPTNNYLPHNHKENAVCYTGTHDNETLRQWYEGAPEHERAFARAYLGLNEEEGLMRGILRSGLASVSRIFVAQMQDWLELGGEARMNTPGLLADCNWSWRLSEMPGWDLAGEIRSLTWRYGRIS